MEQEKKLRTPKCASQSVWADSKYKVTNLICNKILYQGKNELFYEKLCNQTSTVTI